MQYILTQDELDAHRSQVADAKRLPSVKELQTFCSMVADTLPVAKGWYKGKAWGCILTKNKDKEWYCDDCPAAKICPYQSKHWSQ